MNMHLRRAHGEIIDSVHYSQYPQQNRPRSARKAKKEGKSFNQVALEALILGSGEQVKPERDLSAIVGSMSDEEARKIEEEINSQRQVDKEIWR